MMFIVMQYKVLSKWFARIEIKALLCTSLYLHADDETVTVESEPFQASYKNLHDTKSLVAAVDWISWS